MGNDMSKKKSPLKKLVDAHEELNLPVKVTPTKRVVTQVDEVESVIQLDQPAGPEGSLAINDSGLAINNSSLTVNINLSLDQQAVDKAVERSAKIAKSIAAGAAAMIGTAFIFSKDKSHHKVKLPLIPKVKVPKMDLD